MCYKVQSTEKNSPAVFSIMWGIVFFSFLCKRQLTHNFAFAKTHTSLSYFFFFSSLNLRLDIPLAMFTLALCCFCILLYLLDIFQLPPLLLLCAARLFIVWWLSCIVVLPLFPGIFLNSSSRLLFCQPVNGIQT